MINKAIDTHVTHVKRNSQAGNVVDAQLLRAKAALKLKEGELVLMMLLNDKG